MLRLVFVRVVLRGDPPPPGGSSSSSFREVLDEGGGSPSSVPSPSPPPPAPPAPPLVGEVMVGSLALLVNCRGGLIAVQVRALLEEEDEPSCWAGSVDDGWSCRRLEEEGAAASAAAVARPCPVPSSTLSRWASCCCGCWSCGPSGMADVAGDSRMDREAAEDVRWVASAAGCFLAAALPAPPIKELPFPPILPQVCRPYVV
uniref:Uncharacterized protein n=1 Tax=Fibrocapsa japonica TaxID=94617 RepID=A0A7S2V2R2_9STRA|mmetsp:Transcript_23095/g.33551  ORF Transcript_23095/g.33551 Transcript_23095/m.33551 type:complete len:202 (+) Transcript_23095:170-775(+)